MKLSKLLFVVVILLSLLGSKKSSAHCEVPCGVYGDSLRVALLHEHIHTIEKGMNAITKLSKEGTLNYNQLVRWVNNKEKHAEEIQHIMTQYFMFQRVKVSKEPAQQARNQKLLDLIHKICVMAMKAKQSTDLSVVHDLERELDRFSHLYFQKK